MKIEKAQWVTEGNDLRITMPLTKVDQENRLVTGWASLDNVDSQGDVVTAEASRKAFSKFRGNIREMHDQVAVGRMVSFKEDSYYDTETEKFYNGIVTTVRVSEGAPNTWTKVLDGTLQGFSIGGSVLEDEVSFDKAAGKPVRIVKDYQLIELSLVDSPANELANVFSIQKSDNGPVMTGMVAETDINNVFFCDKDQVAKSAVEESMTCSYCEEQMTNIGFFEDQNDRTVKIKEVIQKYKGSVDMAEETAAPVAEVLEEVPVEETVVVEETAVEVSEVEEPDFTKMVEELKSTMTEGFNNNLKAATDAIEKVSQTLEEKAKVLESKITELDVKHQELTKRMDGLSTGPEGVEKSLGEVQADTAVRKSGDLGGSTGETLKKSHWGGRFLGVDAL